jgi:hypothetical protein
MLAVGEGRRQLGDEGREAGSGWQLAQCDEEGRSTDGCLQNTVVFAAIARDATAHIPSLFCRSGGVCSICWRWS